LTAVPQAGSVIAMKHHHSISYAYVWCEWLASWDLKVPMEALYENYAATARHLDHVGNVISPVDFNTWYEIFCEVHDSFNNAAVCLPRGDVH
jgi:hypothetical protein